MAAITAKMVKDLREQTGAGMMDCKAALNEADGNIDEAIEILRKKGLKAASKKADRVAAEGLITVQTSSDKSHGVILETNCETDFVAKNEDFSNFSNSLAQLILDKNPSTVEELSATEMDGSTVEDKLNALTAKIGEKLSIRRFEMINAGSDETIGNYIHMGSKIGVIIKTSGEGATDEIIKDVAMHVAAINPQYLNRDEISQDVIEKEKDIYREQLKAEGKPEDIIEKILHGKIAKFSSEVCLNDQAFIKDPTGKKSVAQSLKDINPNLKITQFIRYQVGEGIEKREDNFAEEVSKMATA